MGKSEGWYFIEDLSGEAHGQIFIGLEIEGGEDNQKPKAIGGNTINNNFPFKADAGCSDIELLRDSVFLNFDYSLMSTEENI